MTSRHDVEKLISATIQVGSEEGYCAALLEMTQRVAGEIAALRDQVLQFERDLQRLILAAKDAGATWEQIAAATKNSVNQVRYRAFGSGDRAWPSATRVKETPRYATKQKVYDGPGVPIIEAARRLGVSRPTIYAWIEQGKLQTVKTARGVRLVVRNDSAIVARARRRAIQETEVLNGDAVVEDL